MSKIRSLFAVLAMISSLAFAAWPDKAVRYVIPFSPGGESDIAARFQQVKFKQKFGQELIVETKVGAGGALAWAQLNSMAADGSVVMGINLPHIVLQPLEGNVQYKTDDLQSVYWFHFTPDALIVTNESPYKTLADFIAAAKAKPGELTIAGSGTNSANHVAHERLNQLGGIKTTYVPFKGTGDLVSSVLGGHVSATMSYVTFAQAQKGKVRMLAVATEKRHPLYPDVPTFKEVGFNWVDGAYRGVAVPKSTPADIQKRISDAFDAINKDPEFRKQMIDGGFEPIDITVDLTPAFLVQRKRDYEAIARTMGLIKYENATESCGEGLRRSHSWSRNRCGRTSVWSLGDASPGSVASAAQWITRVSNQGSATTEKTAMHANWKWLFGALLCAIMANAAAQYPAKPIHIVVPSAPGDGSDLTARLISDKLSTALGQPVIIDNKLGAGGVVGTEFAARQPADGYTLIMANAGSHAINAALYSKLSYDPAKDFTAVALVAVAPNMMSVNPTLPVKSVAEFIAYAKAHPGAINYASGGNGSSAHLSAELFKSMTGIQMNHVPYKGATPALTDLIGGQVQVMIGNLPPMLPHVKAGKLRALAVTTLRRYPGLPEVPTVAESGLAGFETVAWFGLFAPAGTAKEIVNRLNREVNAIVSQPDVRGRLLGLGMEPALGTPEDYTARQTADIAKWKKVVVESGAKVD